MSIHVSSLRFGNRVAIQFHEFHFNTNFVSVVVLLNPPPVMDVDDVGRVLISLAIFSFTGGDGITQVSMGWTGGHC